jgi:hypothetical protein
MPPKIEKQINKSLDNTPPKENTQTKDNTPPKENTQTKIIKTVQKIIKPTTPNNLNVVKEVIKGRNDYPEKVNKILARYGDIPVVGFSLKRTPVSKLLTGALSAASKGEFNKRLQASEYDKLFHLYLEITLETGKKILVEKNEVINMMMSSKRPQEEIRPIKTTPKNLTINIIMKNTKKAMGAKFLKYSADNNCQDFIVSMLRANKIGSASDISFVKQDTKFLFKNLPYLRKMSNTATTAGARVNVLKNLK